MTKPTAIPKPNEAKQQLDAVIQRFKQYPHLIHAPAAGITSAAIITYLLSNTETKHLVQEPEDVAIIEVEDQQPIEVEPEPIAETELDSLSFSEAFAQARAEQGPGGIFEWQGNFYGTYYATEVDENMNPLPEVLAQITPNNDNELPNNNTTYNTSEAQIANEPSFTSEGTAENLPEDIYFSDPTNDYNTEDDNTYNDTAGF